MPPPYSPDGVPVSSAASTPGVAGQGGGPARSPRPPSRITTQTDSTTTADDLDPGPARGNEGIPMQPLSGIPYMTGVDAEFNTPRRWAPVNDGDDDRMLLNVGGVRHETHVSTLRAIPNSRLSRLAELHVQSGGGPQEYFFDRHPAVFNSIIDFYRTGESG